MTADTDMNRIQHHDQTKEEDEENDDDEGDAAETIINNWLVVSTPLKNMTVSWHVDIIFPKIWKNVPNQQPIRTMPIIEGTK